jgi:hypothetical protein
VTLPANFTAGKIYLPNGTFGLAAILSGAFAGGIVPYTTTETFTTVANAEAGIQVVGIFTLTPVNGVQVLRASGNTAPTEALTWSGNSAFFDSGIILTGRIDTFALTITHPGTYAYTMSFETLTGLVIDTTSGTIIVQASTIPTGSSGGGGLSKDNCPKGDNSPSYYDGTCGNSKDTTSQEPASTNDESSSNKAKENVSLEKCSIKGSTYPLEQNTAYLYACDQDITTMRTIQSARVEDQITRAELAKMISQYAISILGKKADLTKDCSAFSDSIASSSQDLQDHMILSCQLGLMGLKGNEYVIDDFRPNDYVTRAEFGTVFSRLLRDDKYQIMDDGPYYIGHLDALKKAGILINTDPNIFEIRGRIMLMMYRVSTSSID